MGGEDDRKNRLAEIARDHQVALRLAFSEAERDRQLVDAFPYKALSLNLIHLATSRVIASCKPWILGLDN